MAIAMPSPKLVLAPAARADAARNYVRSVRRGVALADLEGLPGDLTEDLSRRTIDGRIHAWGNRENKEPVWRQMQRGDVVLFYNDHRFRSVARVADTFISPQFGSA